MKISQNSQESTCAKVSFLIKLQGNFIKKETLAQVFSSEFYEISKNTFSYRTYPVVASVILVSWLWNYVQSQQQKNKVKFVGSLCGRVVGGFGEASSFVWFRGGFQWFLLVTGDIGWFQVVCCFSSYRNFTTYRRVISLLYSWTHTIDSGHSIFLFKVRQQENDYFVLSPSRLKISDYFLSIVLFPILYSMSDKKLLLKEIF